MKVVQFLGGLGNQMFQFAFYMALKCRFRAVRADLTEFKSYPLHNGYELERAFGIKLDLIPEWQRKLYNNKESDPLYTMLKRLSGLKDTIFVERTEFQYDASIFADASSKYYVGYWQNEQYFSELRNELLESFSYKKALSQNNLKLFGEIERSNSVAIHVRRGDYVGHEFLGGICTDHYYQKAIEKIEESIENPTYFVFSNDIPWCKSNLALSQAYFSEQNVGQSSVIDLHLMSHCKHNIIANSTFSWWGAWLNRNTKKIVIAPSKWIKSSTYDDSTMVPPSWLKIDA